ncbi:MAG: hypothetical protein U9R23_07955 [Candidatus Cloacimonadota bacterium]|nr:hypothetical protein [Candidatus Cloacimonadota bacterium]
MGKNINIVYDERLIGDYSFEPVIDKTKALKVLNRAKEFVKKIKEYLEREGLKL